MMVRYVHPDMSVRHFKNVSRTQNDEVPKFIQNLAELSDDFDLRQLIFGLETQFRPPVVQVSGLTEIPDIDECGFFRNDNLDADTFTVCANSFLKEFSVRLDAQMERSNHFIVSHQRDYLHRLYKAWIQKTWSWGRADLELDAFRHAKANKFAHISWPSPMWSPRFFFPEADHTGSGYYDCHKVFQEHEFELSLPEKVQQSGSELREEFALRKTDLQWTPAFGYLARNTTNTNWDAVWIYRRSQYNRKVCKLLSSFCKLLSPYLPTTAAQRFTRSKKAQTTTSSASFEWQQILLDSEEALLLRLRGDPSNIGEHVGRSNSQINIHFPLDITPGAIATVSVQGRKYPVTSDKMHCFNDGTRHGAELARGASPLHEAERTVLVIRSTSFFKNVPGLDKHDHQAAITKNREEL
jgi:hypothetical protein